MQWKMISAVALILVALILMKPPALSSLDSSEASRELRSTSFAEPLYSRNVAASGLVEPVGETRDLAATVIGRIAQIHHDEGEFVQAGTIIAEVENTDLEAELAGAEAAFQARENELARLIAGARVQEIEAARAEVREANAKLEAAHSGFERRQALGEREIVSSEEVEQSKAEFETAIARRDLLRQRLSLLTAPARDEDLAIARANLENARARVSEINARIEKTLIRSPVDGVVLKIHIRTGEAVTNLPPSIVATVGDIRRLRVRAYLDEADVGQVAIGQSVSITADAYQGMVFDGEIARIGAQLAPKTYRTNGAQERLDTNVLEVLIDMEPGMQLPIGLPVDVALQATEENESLILSAPYAMQFRADPKLAESDAARVRDEDPLSLLRNNY